MEIRKQKENGVLLVEAEGRIDTTTAPQAETEIKDGIEDVTSLVIDFSKVEYISSAGLRVLLTLQKIMNKQGSMVIKNANEEIMEIFEITGFSDILTIE